MPTGFSNKRIYWLNHQGIEVLVVNFSGATARESLELIDDFNAILKDHKAGTVRMFTDVTDAQYDPAIANKWKAVRLQQGAKIHASVVVGLSGLVGVAVRSFFELGRFLNLPKSRLKMKIFANRDQALAWLIKA